jgi:hypothetical protein
VLRFHVDAVRRRDVMLDGYGCQVVEYDVGLVMRRKMQKQGKRSDMLRCNNKGRLQGDSIGQIAVACFKPQTFVERASAAFTWAPNFSDIAVTYP